MAAGACRGRCAAAPLPLLSAWGRLRCGSACHRRGSHAGEADAVRRPARDAEAQLPDGTGWPTRSASGVTTTSAMGVRFNNHGDPGDVDLPVSRGPPVEPDRFGLLDV